MLELVKIGTRGSRLALVQAEMVEAALCRAFPGLRVERVVIRTTGDKKQGTALAEAGDKKDWVLEIEESILRGDVHLAVHSGKDVPCDILPETELMPVLDRAPAHDVFLSSRYSRLSELPPGAFVGAASFRRQAQLLRLRPDLKISRIRGNVPTRVGKLGEVDGLVLAAAGLERLGLGSQIRETFTTDDFVPAVNQGTLIAQFRRDRPDVAKLTAALTNSTSQSVFAFERAFVSRIGGDCSSALGIYAQRHGDRVEGLARVLNHSGTRVIERSRSAHWTDAGRAGEELANELLELGARELLDKPHL